jgi:hypothetical protein
MGRGKGSAKTNKADRCSISMAIRPLQRQNTKEKCKAFVVFGESELQTFACSDRKGFSQQDARCRPIPKLSAYRDEITKFPPEVTRDCDTPVSRTCHGSSAASPFS